MRVALIVAAIVLALDGLTKALMPSPTQWEALGGGWWYVLPGNHPGPIVPGWESVPFLALMAALLLVPVARVAAAAFLAAALSNRLWTLHPDGVPNPLVADGRDGYDVPQDLFIWDSPGAWVAYNVADVVLVLGSALALALAAAAAVGWVSGRAAGLSRGRG
jgi:hypothetical protein